jgi:catechol 2,3-dioxygenase-like lactoylglutathione lyase family enzyme
MADDVMFEDVTPVIGVRDLDAALARYRRLGFAARAYQGPERYGYADRGSVSLHLSESAGHDPAHDGAVVYLYVSDADAVHAEWMASGVEGHLGQPCDRPWGMREFTFVDDDGTLHRVGHRMPRDEA